MQFAKIDVPEEYMCTNDEELVTKMEQVKTYVNGKLVLLFSAVHRPGICQIQFDDLSGFTQLYTTYESYQ